MKNILILMVFIYPNLLRAFSPKESFENLINNFDCIIRVEETQCSSSHYKTLQVGVCSANVLLQDKQGREMVEEIWDNNSDTIHSWGGIIGQGRLLRRVLVKKSKLFVDEGKKALQELMPSCHH